MLPRPDKIYAHGSVYPMYAGLLLAELTGKRTEDLKVGVDGTKEGDVCDGSIGWASQ